MSSRQTTGSSRAEPGGLSREGELQHVGAPHGCASADAFALGKVSSAAPQPGDSCRLRIGAGDATPTAVKRQKALWVGHLYQDVSFVVSGCSRERPHFRDQTAGRRLAGDGRALGGKRRCRAGLASPPPALRRRPPPRPRRLPRLRSEARGELEGGARPARRPPCHGPGRTRRGFQNPPSGVRVAPTKRFRWQVSETCGG